MAVCHDNSFAVVGNELTLSRVGAWRPVAINLQPANGDGAFTTHPAPGRTQIDIDTTWINTTGTPQMVMAQVDRAPWLIISTNREQAAFQERWSSAVGVNPRAGTPASTVDLFRNSIDNPDAWVFFFLTSPARAVVSYGAQDRGTYWLMAPTRVEPGEGVNVRYQVALITDSQAIVQGGTPRREAYARYGQLTLWAGPAGRE